MTTGKLKWIVLPLAAMLCFHAYTQDEKAARAKVEDCMNKYRDAMTLGKPVSQEMSNEVINEFKSVFEPDAVLYWDLFKADTAKLGPLPMKDYLSNARTLYEGNKLRVNFPESKNYRIKINKEQDWANVYVTKYNIFRPAPDKQDVSKKIKLKFIVNIYSSKALIQNIYEDTRATRVRTVSAYAGYTAWNNLDQQIKSTATEDIHPGTVQEISVNASPLIPVGIGVELRLNRNKYDGITIETGISYVQQKFDDISVIDYENMYLDTIDANSSNPFSLTVFDRSSELTEKVSCNSFSVPLLFKAYIIKDWAYIKAGPVFSYNLWKSEVQYRLSHTGGDTMLNLETGQKVFIAENFELDDAYGFFPSEDEDLTPDPGFKDFNVSFLAAIGFEKRFSDFAIGLEPTLLVAPSPYDANTNGFEIYPATGYKSLIQSLDLPKYSLSGVITLRFSYFF